MYVFAIGECFACEKAFVMNPNKVPSIGRRYPICKPCVKKANVVRKKNRLPLFIVAPDAYQAFSKDQQIGGLKMTNKLEQRIIEAMQHVWAGIAGDCLVDEGGNPDGSATISGEYVAEVVCDADRLITLGDDEDAGRFYYGLDWDEQRALQRKAFPLEGYGR